MPTNRTAIFLTTIAGGAALPTKSIGDVTTGLTWWGKNDPNYLYTDAGVTKVSAIGQAVYRMAPLHGAINFDQADSALRPTYQAAGVYFDDTDTLASGAANSSFYANNAKTTIMAVQINTGWLNNDQLIGDPSGYYQLKTMTGNILQLLNYDGSNDVVSVSFSNNTPFVVATWHGGGNINISINNGTVATTASGNTAAMTHLVGLFARSTNYLPGYFKEGATWNVALSTDDREQIVRGLMQSYGIS